MKRGYTHIAFLLDRSGSMEAIRDATINAVNRYFDNQRTQPGTCSVTLAQFDDLYEVVYDHVPIGEVAPRTRENFQPRNMTSLHDASVRLIDDVGARLAGLAEDERPERVLVVIQTDGQENASKRFTADDVRERIEHQRAVYRWEFVFLGANHDAVLAGAQLGIACDSSITYAANDAGVAAVMDSFALATSAYRATGAHVKFTAADRSVQYQVGAVPASMISDAANE